MELFILLKEKYVFGLCPKQKATFQAKLLINAIFWLHNYFVQNNYVVNLFMLGTFCHCVENVINIMVMYTLFLFYMHGFNDHLNQIQYALIMSLLCLFTIINLSVKILGNIYLIFFSFIFLAIHFWLFFYLYFFLRILSSLN